MNPPDTTSVVSLVASRVSKPTRDMIEYCMEEAIQRNAPGCISYDCDKDELTYHFRPAPIDYSLLDTLWGVEEIWIIQKAGVES